MTDTMQRHVLYENFQYSKDMVSTASFGGFMSVSYADAVRYSTYANTSSSLLNQYGQLHPGQGFHTGIAWVMAWNLLNAAIDSCDARNMPRFWKDEPRVPPPLPVVTKKTTSDEIEPAWKLMKEEQAAHCQRGEREKSVCVHKWVASKNSADRKEKIAREMEPVLKQNTGWVAYGFPIRQPRRTWLGTGPNATFAIQLDDLSTPINKMMVLYLRSYGREWEDVRLSLIVEGSDSPNDDDWVNLHQTILEGSHNSQTSVNYSHRIDLGDFLQVGSSIRATFTIISGAKFQINGLAICGLTNNTISS